MHSPNTWIKHSDGLYTLVTRKGIRFRLIYLKTKNQWRVRGLLMKPRYYTCPISTPPLVWATRAVYLWLKETAETLEVEAFRLDRDYVEARDKRTKKKGSGKTTEVKELQTPSQNSVVIET